MRRWITHDLSGTGGVFTPGPEDFVVEEIPLYEASGSGEHVYIRIEKVQQTTREIVRRIVDRLNVPERAIGYAGLKDKNSCARQTLSIHGIETEAVQCLEGDGLRIQSVCRHRNKLRVGHLAGNRFEVRLREVLPGATERATAILKRLQTVGLPNYYGAQRFGAGGGNVEQALRVLRGGKRAVRSRWKARFLLSALQSHLFNQCLTRRLEANAYERVLVGDRLMKVQSGGSFLCQDTDTDQPRHDSWELSITGPIFGVKMQGPASESQAEQWESEVLKEAGIELSEFGAVKKTAPGTRRPFRSPVSEVDVHEDAAGLMVRFSLPPGSYATVLVDELTKSAGTSSD